MTQYLKLDVYNRRVLCIVGFPDQEEFVGPVGEPPEPEEGIEVRLWQKQKLHFGARPTASSVLVWHDEAEDPEWIDPVTLPTLREMVWAKIKDARTAAELSDFEFEGQMYQANKEQINGYVTMAMVAIMFQQPFSQQWTLRDNSVQTFNAQRMIALGVALGNHVAGIYAHGRALRAQIDAPDVTPQQLAAITWEAP
jgi:hypothetical protein